MISKQIAVALDGFDTLLDQARFFEAHEVLEGAWIEAKRASHPQTLLLKGLINAAISFEHIKRNRPHSLKSSRITIQSYERYRDHLVEGMINYESFKLVCDKIEAHSYLEIIRG
ncbi:MAG: DUF309 domain-containing protein [Campylobacterota bacterium]|nr:DUF309 domain-containing protein [Campylobacterota bacterium]